MGRRHPPTPTVRHEPLSSLPPSPPLSPPAPLLSSCPLCRGAASAGGCCDRRRRCQGTRLCRQATAGGRGRPPGGAREPSQDARAQTAANQLARRPADVTRRAVSRWGQPRAAALAVAQEPRWRPTWSGGAPGEPAGGEEAAARSLLPWPAMPETEVARAGAPSSSSSSALPPPVILLASPGALGRDGGSFGVAVACSQPSRPSPRRCP